MSDQLHLVAPPPPKAGATQAPTGSPVQPVGATPRPSPDHVLRGPCRDCGQHPNVDPLLMTLKKHNYPRWDAQDRRGRCVGSGTIPLRYHWVIPLVKR